ncbi:EF-P 5-aminopentanol modification-associated protein YfmF [Limosilactobacillus caecicola]|uniref:EF-P 5-aminopentanol modification-associated protein YfmF n=1 Tax=Limosilactobacillus caecicola TaxID=2941332 RepID=UPI0020424952|nr:pitrilysin family protein [Limosilactobacillus caecicola]
MQIDLNTGVRLHIIPSQKYTTNRILVNFAAHQGHVNNAARNLLVNLLINGSQNYPDQTAVARQLSSLYGAELDGYVARLGLAHNVRLSLTYVNDQIVNDSLTKKAVNFLHEVLFAPLREGQVLSPTSWQLQRDNLAATLTSWDDDKQYLAAKRLFNLYFSADSVMQNPGTGTVQDVISLSNAELMNAYQAMLQEDQIDIIIAGNVDVEQVQKLFADWPLQPRQPLGSEIFYRQLVLSKIRQGIGQEAIQQAKLDLAYNFPVYFLDEDYYSAVVMNGLYGASPYSLLFNNVREKASLAYYASSGYRPFGGYLFVQTGINSNNHDQAERLIQEQLMAMQDNDIDDVQLTRIKNGLVNGILTSQDNQGQLMERAVISSLTGLTIPENSVDRILAVNRHQVSAVAQKVKLQATYFLK